MQKENENVQEEAVDGHNGAPETTELDVKRKAIYEELTAFVQKHEIDMLVAINIPKHRFYGAMYLGDENPLTKYGLAAVIEKTV